MSGDDQPKWKTVPAAGEMHRSPAIVALLPKFIGHRERDVVIVRGALERGEFKTISRIGHNMRGNGHSYGFPDIGLIGEGLEAAANANDPSAVREYLMLLEAWVDGHRSEQGAQARADAVDSGPLKASANARAKS